MFAEKAMGLYIDYEYVHKTLERTYQINSDPNQIIEAIDKILAEQNGKVAHKKAYAMWDKYQQARQVFEENAYLTVNTACARSSNTETTPDLKTGTSLNSLELAICCDVMESVMEDNLIKSYCLVLGDGRYEELLKRLKKKERNSLVIGFGQCTADNLKANSDSFINLDVVITRYHTEDYDNVIQTCISLSRKLPYVGFKYLLDILSRNDLHTDYRQLLNLAQEEGIIRLVEVDDPNTIRGKAFAIELDSEHPIVAKHLADSGLGRDALLSPASVPLKDDNGKEYGGSPGSGDHGDTKFLAGKRLAEIGQHLAAITEFINYLEDFPNDFLAFVYVINCLIKNDDRKQAGIWCKRALTLPNTPHNQKEYPRWFTYMKRMSASEEDIYDEEEERIELSG